MLRMRLAPLAALLAVTAAFSSTASASGKSASGLPSNFRAQITAWANQCHKLYPRTGGCDANDVTIKFVAAHPSHAPANWAGNVALYKRMLPSCTYLLPRSSDGMLTAGVVWMSNEITFNCGRGTYMNDVTVMVKLANGGHPLPAGSCTAISGQCYQNGGSVKAYYNWSTDHQSGSIYMSPRVWVEVKRHSPKMPSGTTMFNDYKSFTSLLKALGIGLS